MKIVGPPRCSLSLGRGSIGVVLVTQRGAREAFKVDPGGFARQGINIGHVRS